MSAPKAKAKAKAEDMGFIEWLSDGTGVWRWRLSPEVEIMDRTVGCVPQSVPQHKLARSAPTSFRLIIREDPEIEGYQVTTCGTHGKGGTRHRWFATQIEALQYGLRWLNRRYGVKITTTKDTGYHAPKTKGHEG